MFNVGMPELLVILGVALIVLGPKRLPEVARMLGKAMAEFRKATSGINQELDNARAMLEEEAQRASAPPVPSRVPPSGTEAKSTSGPSAGERSGGETGTPPA
jgi:Tat protein translocase TatB subunit